jgi:hypothetical protein
MEEGNSDRKVGIVNKKKEVPFATVGLHKEIRRDGRLGPALQGQLFLHCHSHQLVEQVVASNDMNTPRLFHNYPPGSIPCGVMPGYDIFLGNENHTQSVSPPEEQTVLPATTCG